MKEIGLLFLIYVLDFPTPPELLRPIYRLQITRAYLAALRSAQNLAVLGLQIRPTRYVKYVAFFYERVCTFPIRIFERLYGIWQFL